MKSQLKYIAVLEKQKREAWHAYILPFRVPYIPHSQLLELWRHRAVRINKVDVDSKENPSRYVTKYFEKGIRQELLENFSKQAYLSSRNLKKPDEDKFYTYETFDYNSSTVLYKTEYTTRFIKTASISIIM
ncbi:putative phasyl DNA replicon protein [Streptococcus milleri]|uniref:Phasyl DNA replicon protein n=1 Tax=Streptococcus milleri TaxID=33040 RepID=A0A380L6G5_9STRE|nr:putative phasyl DNA replicon protein [Streptococcus milleri]